jgi:hypothetical protein
MLTTEQQDAIYDALEVIPGAEGELTLKTDGIAAIKILDDLHKRDLIRFEYLPQGGPTPSPGQTTLAHLYWRRIQS